jgi:hypothetical protein
MTILRRYPVTSIATFLAFFIAITHLLFQHNLFNYVVELIDRVDQYGLDELIIPILLMFAGRYVDLWRARRKEEREAELQSERLRILRATMRTVQDIVNNFLNNLQLFRLEAEAGGVSAESWNALDDLVQATSARLTVLGDLDSVPERLMATGTGIDLDHVA